MITRKLGVALVGDDVEGYHIVARIQGKPCRMWYGMEYGRAYRAFSEYVRENMPEEMREYARPPERVTWEAREGKVEGLQLELW